MKLEREKEISKKENELIFDEHFCLSEFQQITWCFSTKQKCGTVRADYEILQILLIMKTYSTLRLILTQNGFIKTCREKSVSTWYQNTKKLPVVYLIIYHRYLNDSKWYLQCHLISTGLNLAGGKI